jgi:hypothetical protein
LKANTVLDNVILIFLGANKGIISSHPHLAPFNALHYIFLHISLLLSIHLPEELSSLLTKVLLRSEQDKPQKTICTFV